MTPPSDSPPPRSGLLPGTLDMLVLRTLSLGSLHGYGIAQHLERMSDGALRVEQGSLYPALERLQNAGSVSSKWGKTSTGRRARYDLHRHHRPRECAWDPGVHQGAAA